MRRFVPLFVEEARRSGRLQGSFPGAVLFTDVSGFTTLTERAFAGGDRGAELLYAALRAVFDPMVDDVYAAGGFVAGFAGDSFTAIFPDGRDIPAAPSARAAARRILERTSAGPARTPLGEVPLAVRCGVADGDVSWGLLRSVAPGASPSATTRTTDLAEIRRRAALREKQRHAWYFRGEPVDEAARRASVARVDASAAAIAADPPDAPRLPATPEDPDLPDATLRLYFPEDLVAAGESPELRHVAGVFVKLLGAPAHATLELLHAAVLPLVEDHGGTLNKVDFGDKGSTLYLHFGAPRFLEHPEAAAAGFARSLLFDVLPRFAGVSAGIGIDAGRAYCGILGGSRRNEWTCTGNPVNTAARLMMEAAPGEVVVSGNVASSPGTFHYEHRGRKALKGRTTEVDVHLLAGRSTEAAASRTRLPFVGRRSEIERVATFVERRLVDRAGPAVMVIAGDEGLGKSRLVSEAVAAARARRPVSWIALHGDAQRHRGWSSLLSWLEAELAGDARDPSSRPQEVERAYARLAQGADAPLREELERTRPFVGEVLGCRWPGSLYETVTDPTLRHGNRVAGIVAILRARARRGPLVVSVDDAQALDSCSADAVAAVARASHGLAVALVLTCRSLDDPLPLARGADSDCIALGPLDPVEVARTLSEELLPGKLRDDALALLAARAQGNPAFTAALLQHLETTGALVDDGRGILRLASDTAGLPATVASLLTARLQGLSADAREALKAGAVLGSDFETDAIAELLAWPDERAAGGLAEAASRGLLAPLASGALAFRPAALRHAVDSLLLPSARAALHARALAYLSRASDAVQAARAEELANHARGAREAPDADIAALEEQERKHLTAAATTARERGDYRHAEHLLERLAASTHADPGTIESLWQVKNLLGHVAEAEEIAATTLADARQRGDARAELRGIEMVAMLHQQASRFEEAERADAQALELATALHDARAGAKAHMRRGNIQRARGDPAGALRAYRAALALLPDPEHARDRSLVLANEATALTELGDLEAAEAAYRSALAQARAERDLRAVAFRLANLSGVLWARGAVDEAERLVAEAAEVASAIGARTAEISSRGHMAGFQLRTGRLDAAAATFSHVLRLCQEIGDAHGESETYWHLAELDRHAGRFADAAAGFAQAAAIGESRGDRVATCRALVGTAALELDRGDLDAAEAALRAALAPGLTTPRVTTPAAVLGAALAARRGDVTGALASLEEIRSGAVSIEETRHDALLRIAELLLGADRIEEAAAALAEAAPACRSESSAMRWLEHLGLSAHLEIARGRPAAAREPAQTAADAAARMGAAPLEIVAGLAPLFHARMSVDPGDVGGLRALAERMTEIVRRLDLGDTSDAGRAAAACRERLRRSDD